MSKPGSRSPWRPSMSWSNGMASSPLRRASCPSRSRSLVCRIPMASLGLSETNTIGSCKEKCMRECLGHINDFMKHHLVHLLTCTVCVGVLWPRASLGIKDLVLFQIPGTAWPFDLPTFALCCMMFSASTHCRLCDFIRLATTPRAFLLGLSLVYLLLPGVGWATATVGTALLGPTVGPQIAAGLVLVVLMPVAMTANLWVKVVEGNLVLLVSLITCTTALSIVVTPLSLSLILGLAQNDLQVPTALLMKQLLVAVTMPMLVGMLLRAWSE